MRLLHVFADLRTYFDLRTQKFRRNLGAAQLFRFRHQALRRIDDQAARFLVDQQIFFFYAERE